MEPEIFSTLPTGNPILAYGTSGRFNKTKAIKIITAIFGALLCAALIWFIFYFSFPFPSQTVLLMATKNNGAFNSTPNIWGRAAQNNIRPLVLGMAWTDKGFVPFVITLRKGALAAEYKYDVGPVNILSDEPLALESKRKTKDILGLVLKLAGDNQGFLVVDGGIFLGEKWPIISGPISDGIWKTDLDLSAPQIDLPKGDVAINTKILPQAWPPIRNALEMSGLVNLPSDTPSLVAWHVNNTTIGSLELQYENNIPQTALQQMSAAAGIYSVKIISLPDGNVAEEFELPNDSLSTNTTSSGDYRLLTTTNTLLLSFNNASDKVDTDIGCQLDDSILNIKGEALELLMDRLKIPTSIQFSAFEAASQNGNLIFCLK
ncbi:MAG: hypothetical protein ABIB04_00135 [Patescibacteria group bacterium]